MPPAETEARDPQAAACAYLLHMLLQREEARQPGFIAALIDGVQADQRGVAADLPNRAYIDSIFAHTLTLLQHADAGAQAASMAPERC